MKYKHINEMNIEEVRYFIHKVLRVVDRRNKHLPMSVLEYAFEKAYNRLHALQNI